jgi:hypothetical protein
VAIAVANPIRLSTRNERQFLHRRIASMLFHRERWRFADQVLCLQTTGD